MKTILVVDDEIGTAYVLCQLLREDGFAATCAANAVSALEAATATVPDVIIVDYMMPNMTGGELIKTLRSNTLFDRTEIILCSGLPESMISAHVTGVAQLAAARSLRSAAVAAVKARTRRRWPTAPPAEKNVNC